MTISFALSRSFVVTMDTAEGVEITSFEFIKGTNVEITVITEPEQYE